MIDYWIKKYGLKEAAEVYYEGPKDAVFNVLLAQYKAAEFALEQYMIQHEVEVEGE